MNFQDLIQLYEEKKRKYGKETYRYVLSEENIEESKKVKMFDKLIGDLKKLIS